MWEIELKKGRYLRERVIDPLTGREKIMSVKITKNTVSGRREAMKRLEAKLESSGPKRLLLSDLIEIYKKEHVRSVRESTYKRDCGSLATMLDVVGDIFIDQMTAGYIRAKLVDSGKENGTLNELIKRFKTFLMWAYRNDYLSREVADKLTMFPDRSAREKVENKFLEKEELRALIKAMDLERWQLLTEFLALSGLRVGEAIALDNKDVGGEYIHVSKTYNEALALLGDAKTASSVRDVFIQPELSDVIRRVHTCMLKQRLKFGYTDQGYFFSGIDGERVGYAAYNKYLKQTAAAVVPKKTVTPHTLRHTMTSLFAESGIPLDVIARRLGHESSDLTKRIYLHITENRKIKDNQSIASITLLA